jgi:hypothetical protein
MQQHDSPLHLSWVKSFLTRGYAQPGHLVNNIKTARPDDEPHDTQQPVTAIQKYDIDGSDHGRVGVNRTKRSIKGDGTSYPNQIDSMVTPELAKTGKGPAPDICTKKYAPWK